MISLSKIYEIDYWFYLKRVIKLYKWLILKKTKSFKF